MKKYVTDIINRTYFEESEVSIGQYDGEENNIINVHPSILKQNWLGLGGALTGATIYNYNKMNDGQKFQLLDDYFNQLNYNFVRIPIGSTDFSVKPEENYLEDFDENIKVIKEIKKIKNIKTILTPWSPPSKYKDNASLYGGKLKKECYDEYASYLANCINDYEFAGVNVDYLSVQNEPQATQRWESCKFEISELKDFIYNNLIPKLNGTKIILWDHNKENLYNVFKELYKPNNLIAGIGFHWYSGGFYDEMQLIKNEYPNVKLFETEMCCGFSRYNRKKWIVDAEYYLSELINGINHGLDAFIDWNMFLDYKGGPNYKHNNCKSPIILDKREDRYIKTPIYYYLKHIGVANMANVVATSSFERRCDIKVVALKNDKTYITILNTGEQTKEINIKMGAELIRDKIHKHSVITYVS